MCRGLGSTIHAAAVMSSDGGCTATQQPTSKEWWAMGDANARICFDGRADGRSPLRTGRSDGRELLTDARRIQCCWLMGGHTTINQRQSVRQQDADVTKYHARRVDGEGTGSRGEGRRIVPDDEPTAIIRFPVGDQTEYEKKSPRERDATCWRVKKRKKRELGVNRQWRKAVAGHSFLDAGRVSFSTKTTGCLLKPHSPLPVEALGLINLQSVWQTEPKWICELK